MKCNDRVQPNSVYILKVFSSRAIGVSDVQMFRELSLYIEISINS